MAKPKREIMIVDYAKCIRVPPEDASYARESTPYRCPACASASLRTNLTKQTVSGRLRFAGDRIPLCEDHSPAIEMEAVNGR
jgi:hypothetical protein